MRNWHAGGARTVLTATVALLVAVGLVQFSLPSPAAAIDPGTYYYTVTVTLTGNGVGSTQSTDSSWNPSGFIDCHRNAGITSGNCSHAYYAGPTHPTIQLYFLSTAALGSTDCYLGCHGGTLAKIQTPISHSSSVADGFALTSPQTLTVSKSGTGTGTVVSHPAGITCGSACTLQFASGSAMGLTATAGAGSTFAGWSGSCSGQGSTCFFTLSATTAIDAVFTRVATPTRAPTPKPTPAPTVQASLIAAASSIDAGALPTPETTPQASISDSLLQSVLGATGAPRSPDPGGPGATGNSGSDSTPIAIAIGFGALVLALGMGFLGFELRRRRLGS